MKRRDFRLLVTGGAGFIGANFVRKWIAERDRSKGAELVVLDALTYAGNPMNLEGLPRGSFSFIRGSILDEKLVSAIFRELKIDAVAHFAAESHVDRSITGPRAFVETNVLGTEILLECAHAAWKGDMEGKRFLHVSTDEVYGSLSMTDPAFTEETPYDPRSPYSASKAGSDHLVMAYHHTFGLPTLMTNCSNNYGPYQFPEKLIPLMIQNCLKRKPLPVYGKGENVRDWLFVNDHCAAIEAVLERGRIGEKYNVGGKAEMRNIDLVRLICQEMAAQLQDGFDYESLISYVTDRPGHDFRYAMDFSKLERELGWKPSVDFRQGLRKTIQWYLANPEWLASVQSGGYRSRAIEQEREL